MLDTVCKQGNIGWQLAKACQSTLVRKIANLILIIRRVVGSTSVATLCEQLLDDVSCSCFDTTAQLGAGCDITLNVKKKLECWPT